MNIASFLTAALWGMVVFVSWIGWGTLIAWYVDSPRRVAMNWALRAGMGMAVNIALGGLLLPFHAAGPETLMLIVAGGVAVAAYEAWRVQSRVKWRSRMARWWHDRPAVAVSTLFILLAAFFYLSSVNTPGMLNAFDDLTTYLVFVQRLLQLGTIIEPFNWRRLSTYGGQQVLQAPLVLMGDFYSANIIDMGLSNIIMMGIGMWLVRGRSGWRRLAQAGVILLIALTPVPRANTQSQCSTAALLLTIYGLMQLHDGGRPRKGLACVIGLVAAAACTFRMNIIPVALLAVTLGYGFLLLLRRDAWRTWLINLCATLATMAIVLTPYALALYESSQSFLFPLMQGTHRQEYQLTGMALSFNEHCKLVSSFFLRPEMIGLFFPMLLIPFSRSLRRALPLYIAGIIGTAALVWAFPRSDTENSIRLTFCVLFAPALVVFALWLAGNRPMLRWSAALLLAAAIILPAGTWTQHLRQMADAAWNGPRFRNGYPIPMSNEAYRAAQESIPPGAAFIAATGVPVVFDYRRNVIYNVDSPGTASLSPGMPLYSGPEAMKNYLLSLGINYLITTDFDHDIALYSRHHWNSVAADPETHSLWDQASYRPALAFFHNVDALAQSEDVLFSSGRLRVIRLRPTDSKQTLTNSATDRDRAAPSPAPLASNPTPPSSSPSP